MKLNKEIILSIFLLFSCSNETLDFREATAKDILSTVAAQKGEKAVLVNYWATWCAPCIEEFPMIVELSKEYSEQTKVFFVSADFLEHKDKAKEYLKRQGVEGISFIKNEKDDDFINGIHKDWSGALPFTIVYDKNSGNVVDFWEAKKPESRFLEAIKVAINEGDKL